MEKINVLKFKMFDPIEAGEPWAVDFGSNHKVVEVIIDGENLLEVIRRIEKPYLQSERCLWLQDCDHDYGHVSQKDLYDDLLSATVKGSFAHDFGVYLFCCGGCGEPGCWSVTCRVKEDDKFVFWFDFKHEHRDWDYNLKYKFEKKAYQTVMNELQFMSNHQKIEQNI